MFFPLRDKLTTKKEIILKVQYSFSSSILHQNNSKSCMYFLMHLSTTNPENWTCNYWVFHKSYQFLVKNLFLFVCFQEPKEIAFGTPERERKSAFNQSHLMQPKSHLCLIRKKCSWCSHTALHWDLGVILVHGLLDSQNPEILWKSWWVKHLHVSHTPPGHWEPLSCECKQYRT